MKKTAILLACAMLIATPPAAQADSQIYSKFSNENSSYPPGLSSSHRLFILSVAVMQSNPSEIILKTGFMSAINNSTFSLQSPQAQLRVIFSDFPFATREDWGYVTVETPMNTSYQGTTKIDAVASAYIDPTRKQAGGRKSLSDCKPKTWLEPGSPISVVAFSIDRVCADIPNAFYVNAFVDSNIYNSSSVLDWKYAPVELMYVDMNSIPRPPKMMNQTVTFERNIGTQNLDNPNISTRLTSSMGLPVTVNSQTPSVCAPSVNGLDLQIKLLSQGTCSLEAFAAGNSGVNPSPRVVQSFTVNPKVMIRQDLSWNEPSDVMVGDDPFSVDIFTSSGLPLQASSNSPNVCRFSDPSSPLFITIVGSGTCSITVRAEATDKYFSASGTASFQVAPKPVVPKPKPPANEPSSSTRAAKPAPPLKVFGGGSASADKQTRVDVQRDTAKTNTKASKKNITITCTKGALTRKVTAPNPKCPSGYKKQ